MRNITRGRRWTGWLTRTPSLLRPFPVLRAEQLEDRLAPATFAWSGAGADTKWSNPANWVGNVAPTGLAANLEDLVFPAGPSKKAASNDLAAGGVFNSISFAAGGYTLTGNSIILGLPSTIGSGFIVVNAGSLGNILNIDTKLGASAGIDQTITVQTGADLTINSKISGTSGSTLTKDGPGTLTFTNDNSGFTGTIRLNNNSGALVITNSLALGDTTAPTIVGTNSSLRVQNVATAINEPLILNGLGVANDGALLNLAGANGWAGPITLDSDTAIGATAGTLAITGVISDLGAGHNLIKEGVGEIRLDSPSGNTYRGTTTVNNGVLTVGSATALGAAGIAANGTIVNQTLTGAGQLRLSDPTQKGFTVANELLTLNGAGLGSLTNPGSLTNLIGNNTWAGPVTLGSPAPDGKDVTIGAAANTNLTISGVVSSPNGGFQLIKRDQGRLILNNANTYTGLTSVQEGVLNIRDSQGLGTTANGTNVSNGAALEFEVEAADPVNIPRFDAQGRDLWDDSVTHDPHRLWVSEPLNILGRGVNNTGALRSVSGLNKQLAGVSLTFSPNVQDAIGVDPDQRPGHPTPDNTYFINDYSLTVNGNISGEDRTDFIKRNAGHLILPRDNSYTGRTRVEQGWVTIQSNRAFGADKSPLVSDTVQPATFVSNGAAVHIKPLTPASPPLTIPENINIQGVGITHPYSFISKKGALMNLGGANIWSGDIGLANMAGIGVEQTDPASFSDLVVIGSVRDGQNSFSFTASGGEAEEHFLVDTGVTFGKIRVEYEMYSIPDKLTVYYPAKASGGSKIIDTGSVSGSKIVTATFGPGASTVIEVVMNEGGGIFGTAWDLLDVSVLLPGGLVKLGSKKLRLRGDGSYSGATEIREGTLGAQSDTALGLSSTGTYTNQQTYNLTPTTVFSGGVLELTGGVAPLNGGIAAGIQVWNELLVLNNPGYQVAVAGVPGGTFSLTYAAQTTGPLSITATATDVETALNALPAIVAAGGAKVSLTGNIYTVLIGTVQSPNAGILVATPANGAEVTVSGGNFSLVNLSDDNAWRGPVNLNTSSRVDVEPNSRLSLLGAVSDSTNPLPAGSDFVKRGLGELVLAGSNSFRGTTAIDEGVLTAMNSQAFGATTGGTVVANGAQLQLQGSLTIAGEPLTVQGSGAGAIPNFPARWLNAGPAPTNNGLSPQNLPTTGRITSVAADPTDPDVIYVATAGGGAWKSKNGGLTWLPLFDNTADNAALMFGGAIAVSATNPKVVYYATGDSNGGPNGQQLTGPQDNYAGSGVYRSTDAGQTWALLTGPGGVNPLAGQSVTRLIVDPGNPDLIYVASGTSNLLNANLAAVPGVYRYQVGGSWVNLTAAVSPNRNSVNGQSPFDSGGQGPPKTPGPDDDYRVDFPQANATWSDILLIGNTLYAALGESNQTTGNFSIRNGVYRTTNPTSNNPTWYVGAVGTDTRTAGFPLGDIPSGPARNSYIKLAGSGSTIYASVARPNTGDLLDIQKSTDGGVTWTATGTVPAAPFGTAGNGLVALGRYDHTLLAESTTTVYLGGLNAIFRTSDGGATWGAITPDAQNRGPASQFHSLFLDVGGRLLSGSDGGVWRLNNNLYENLSGNLSATQLNSADPHPTDPGQAVAGSADNGTQIFSGGLDWQRSDDTAGTNSGVVRYDPLNPATIYAVRDGLLRKSINGGTSWTTLVDISSAGPSYFPLIVDSVNTSRLLIGGGTLRESVNGGASFVGLAPNIGVTAIGAATFQGQFAADPGFPTVVDRLSNTYDPGTVYVTDGTSLRLTKNRGVSWVARTPTFTDRSFTVTFGGTLDNADQPQMTSTGGHSAVTTVTNGSASPAASEVQRVTLYALNGSFFTLTFNGQTTGPIAVNATVAQIKAAIELLSNVGPAGGTVTVTAGASSGESLTITDLAVDPSNRDTVYATLNVRNGVNAPRVLRSTSAGQNWTDITDNPTFPASPAWRVVVDPRTGTAYIGNDNGIWQLPNAATDTSFAWTRVGSGMPRVQVRDIVLNQTLNTLTAATHGRGMFQLFLPNSEANSGAVRAVSGSSVWTGPVTLVGDTALGAAGTQQIQNGISAASLNILGTISDSPTGGNFTLRKIGRGTITLSGTNTYGGQTLVQEGILQVNNPHALGAPTAAGNTTVTAGAALELRSDLELEPVTINGDGFLFNGHNTGALRNVSNDNTYTGTLTFGTNTTIGVDSGTSLTIGQKPGTLVGIGTMTDAGNNFNLDKELSGTLILGSANTYGGLTRVVQGALQVQDANALGSTATGTQVLDGAAMHISRNGATLAETVVAGEPLSLSGTGIFGTGVLRNVRGDSNPAGTNNNTWQGPVQLTISPNFFPQTAPGSQIGIGVTDARDTLTIDGVISQDSKLASFGLIKVGPGRLALTRANTFTGVVNINEGSVRVLNNGALGAPVSPEVQTLNVIGTVGSYTLTLPGFGTTGNLAASATAAAVQAALEVLVGAGYVIVSESATVTGKLLTVTFGGPLSTTNMPQMTANPSANLAVNIVTAQDGGLGTVVATGAALEVDGTQFGGSLNIPERLMLNGDGLAGTGGLNNIVGNNIYSGDVTLASNTSIGALAGTGLAVANKVQDPTPSPVPSARLQKTGLGTVLFANSNTYGGKTDVAQGVLVILDPFALGTVRPEIQEVQVFATNGTFSLTFNGQTTAPLAYNALDTDVQTALNALSNIGPVGGSVTVVRTAVSGGFKYTVTFGGTLNNASLPQITTTVTGGVIAFVATIQDGSEGTTVQSGATLQIANGITMKSELVTINGAGFNGQGALNNLSGNNTWAIPLTLGSNSTIGVTGAGNTLNFTAPITDNGKAYNLDIVGPGTVQYSGTVDNQYTGTTTVREGVLQLNQASGLALVGPLVVGDKTGGAAVTRETLPNQIGDTVPVTVNSDGTFDLNDQTDTIGTLTVNDGLVLTGAGRLTTSGVSMTGGTILAGAGGALVLAGNVTATSSATQTPTIAGPGAFDLNGADRTLTVADGPQGEDLLFSAVLTATAGEQLIKDGPGRLAISGTTFSAPINVLAGDVQVSSTADIGPVRLAGGSLSGTGFVDSIAGQPGAAVGTVNPGINYLPNPAGILNSTGNVTWGPQTTFHVDLASTTPGAPTVGTDYDQLSVTGNVDLGGAVLTGHFGAGILLGDQFTIVQTEGGTVTGHFAEPYGANVVFIEGHKFTVDYSDPTKVVLTKIKADATVAVVSSVNPSTLHQPVLFTATVTPEPGAGALSNSTVTFTLDGTAYTLPMDDTGIVVFDPQLVVAGGFLTGGTHTLSVLFNGDPVDFNPAGPVDLIPDQLVEVPVIDPLVETPPFISPNNSTGIQDTASITTTVREERSATNWTVTIRDSSNAVVRTITGTGVITVNTFPIDVTWDGKDDNGNFVPDGEYTATATFLDEWTNTGTTAPVTITVDNTSPTAGPLTSQYDIIAPGTNSTVPMTTNLTGTVGDTNLTGWTITVTDGSNTVIRTFTGTGTAVNANWDGRDTGGAIVPDGFYNITLTAHDAAGNSTTAAAVTVVVLTHPPAVTLATNSPTVYGQAITLTATVSLPFTGLSNLLAGDTIEFFRGTTSLGTATLSVVGGQYQATLTVPTFNAGTYTDLTAVYLPTAEFLRGVSPAVTHIVNKAALTVTADNKTKLYGSPLPPLTFTTAGLTNGDTAAGVLSGALATTANQQSSVGTYDITQGSLTLTSGNYILTFVPGTLTITPAPLTVSANNLTKVYGSPLPTLTYTTAGLMPWDTVGGVLGGNLATTATAASNVGAYPITQGTVALTTGNYTLTFVPGMLTVIPASLVVTADNQVRLYGDANPTLTYSVNGLVNGDTTADVLTGQLTTTADVPSNVGVYPITQGNLAVNANYTLAFVNGTLTVNPAPLTIRADDLRRVFNTPNPPLTATYTGLRLGDPTSVVTGLHLVTAANIDSLVGKYPIVTDTTPTAQNYAITFVPGTLTVGYLRPDEIVAIPPAVAFGSGSGVPAQVNFFNPPAGLFQPTVSRFDPGVAFDRNFTGGVRVAAADFNGDGVSEIVLATGPGGPTLVTVLDGKTRQEIFRINPFEASFTGGVFVAAGDVTGDGVPDLVISPDEGGGPRVRLFSGDGFGQVADFLGIDDPNFRGGARAGIGDINADGYGDLVVAAGFGGGPRVAAFSGKGLTRGEQSRLFGDFFIFGGTDATTLRNGVFISAGDINGDGFADVVAGGGPGGGPRVLVADGRTLMASNGQTVNPLANFFAGDPNNRGGVRVAVKKLDLDQYADLVVGAGDGGGSRVTGYNGQTMITSTTPPAMLSFDAFDNVPNGVFVG